MPFVDIRLAGNATREQKSAIVADVTRSLVERLGKPASAVQVVISEISMENYGSPANRRRPSSPTSPGRSSSVSGSRPLPCRW